MGALEQPGSLLLSAAQAWPAYGSSGLQSTEGLPAQSKASFCSAPLLLLSVMTFVRRRIGGGGVILPPGERERGMEEGETQRHVDRQECGLWKYELIFFFFLLRSGRRESSKENRLQAGWHAGLVLGTC